MAAGTLADPMTFTEALDSERVRPGYTVWMRAGIYSGDFVSSRGGTATAPITFRPYPGETVVLDGSLEHAGDYIILRDLEIRDTKWPGVRTFSSKEDCPRPYHVYPRGDHQTFINCIIHDGKQVTVFSDATNTLFYGCIIYNHGIMINGAGAHHNVYTQNAADTGTKTFDTCIFGACPREYGFHAYAEQGQLANFVIQNCIFVGDYPTCGGLVPVVNLIFANNYLQSFARLGYGAVKGQSAIVTGNQARSLEFYRLADLTVTGNTLRSRRPYLVLENAGEARNWTFDKNVYNYDSAVGDVIFQVGTNEDSLATWRAVGYDANSTFNNTLEAGDGVYVIPNTYDANRWHVVIYNLAEAKSVACDFSRVLEKGDTCRLYNAQNPLVEYFEFAYTGAAVAVPMTEWTVAVAAGFNTAFVESSFPSFGAFILIRVAAAE